MKILAAVELGSPAADCAHFGICSVDVLSPAQWAAFRPCHVRHVKAILSRSGRDCLRFEFPLDGMRADTRAQFFPPEGFRVDSAKALPCSVTDALGLPPGIHTLPGVYALDIWGDGLGVGLSLIVGEAMAVAA